MDIARGIQTRPLVGFTGTPVMAAIYQDPQRPTINCICWHCAGHLSAIDQLAEKVAIGASEEVRHWTNISWTQLVVSDWQDILEKKQQAYWEYKALSRLAIQDRRLILSLSDILRVIESLEAVVYLPSGLTRQVEGEPLCFDDILHSVFAKVTNSIDYEARQTLQGTPSNSNLHCLLLLVDTFNIYANTFPVTTRTENIAMVAALYVGLRAAVPPSCLVEHTFTGVKFDGTNENWTATRPITLPSSIPLNHARRRAAKPTLDTPSS